MFTRAPLRALRAVRLPTRVFLGGVIVVALMLVLVFAMLSRWAQRSGDAAVQRDLEQSADLAGQFLAGRQRSLTGGARVFVQGPNFRAIVSESRVRDDVLDQTLEAADQLDADWVFIVDQRGTLLAKSDEPGAAGGDLSGVPLVAGALQGRVMSGFGVSRDSLLFQAVAVPIVVPGQAPIGALIATKIVDSLLARDVKAATGADVAFFVRDTAGARIAASSFGASLGRLPAAVTEQPRSRATINGQRYSTQAAAVTTAGGDVIGGFVVMSARDVAGADIAEVRHALLYAALVGLALSGVAAAIAARRVARPMRALTAVAERAIDGDFGAMRDDSREHAVGELATLDVAMHRLVGELRDRQALALTLDAMSSARASASAAVAMPATATLTMHRVQGGPSRTSTMPTRTLHAARDESSRTDPSPGDIIADRYVVEAVLGADEMGVTYRVRDRLAGRVVALKRLRSARLGDDAPKVVSLLRESLASVRKLTHRNIVRAIDAGEELGVPFVTMDLVEGTSLAELLRAGAPLGEDALLSVAKQLCRALDAAAACGVVHGNLSPARLIVGNDGVLKVSDFVLAQVERKLRLLENGRSAAESGASIPQLAGATVGTPEYMAPEQLLGEEPTLRSDLYAAGVVLYQCATGATPFRTDSPLAFLAQKLGNSELHGEADALRPTQPSRSTVTLALSTVITRMIAADAEQRPSAAGTLLELLERAG